MRTLFLALPAMTLALATPSIAQTDAAKPAKPASDPNKVICKRETQIGTLVGGRKVCRTRAEWSVERNNAQRETERMQNQLGAQGPG